jgi:CRISPR-associated endonuclease Cas3-HD
VPLCSLRIRPITKTGSIGRRCRTISWLWLDWRPNAAAARRAAALAGILHDLGKYSAAFRRRLDGSGEAVDHSTAGAKHVGRLVAGGVDRGMAELIAYVIGPSRWAS